MDANPLYEKIKDAAQRLNKEKLFICHPNDVYFLHKNNTVEENEDLVEEIMFLRSSLEYFYRTGMFPYTSPETAFEFATTQLFIPVEYYFQDNKKYMEMFKNRVLKICSKLESLETSHEQDAFELGIRVWGTLSLEMLKRRIEQGRKESGYESIDYSPDYSHDDDDDDDDDEDDDDIDGDRLMNGVLEKHPLLKRAIRVCGGGAKMPRVLKELVESGAEKLGEERVNEMDEQWKTVQLEYLLRFIGKISDMRIQANDLMNDLQRTLDSQKD